MADKTSSNFAPLNKNEIDEKRFKEYEERINAINEKIQQVVENFEKDVNQLQVDDVKQKLQQWTKQH